LQGPGGGELSQTDSHVRRAMAERAETTAQLFRVVGEEGGMSNASGKKGKERPVSGKEGMGYDPQKGNPLQDFTVVSSGTPAVDITSGELERGVGVGKFGVANQEDRMPGLSADVTVQRRFGTPRELIRFIKQTSDHLNATSHEVSNGGQNSKNLKKLIGLVIDQAEGLDAVNRLPDNQIDRVLVPGKQALAQALITLEEFFVREGRFRDLHELRSVFDPKMESITLLEASLRHEKDTSESGGINPEGQNFVAHTQLVESLQRINKLPSLITRTEVFVQSLEFAIKQNPKLKVATVNAELFSDDQLVEVREYKSKGFSFDQLLADQQSNLEALQYELEVATDALRISKIEDSEGKALGINGIVEAIDKANQFGNLQGGFASTFTNVPFKGKTPLTEKDAELQGGKKGRHEDVYNDNHIVGNSLNSADTYTEEHTIYVPTPDDDYDKGYKASVFVTKSEDPRSAKRGKNTRTSAAARTRQAEDKARTQERRTSRGGQDMESFEFGSSQEEALMARDFENQAAIDMETNFNVRPPVLKNQESAPSVRARHLDLIREREDAEEKRRTPEIALANIYRAKIALETRLKTGQGEQGPEIEGPSWVQEHLDEETDSLALMHEEVLWAKERMAAWEEQSWESYAEVIGRLNAGSEMEKSDPEGEEEAPNLEQSPRNAGELTVAAGLPKQAIEFLDMQAALVAGQRERLTDVLTEGRKIMKYLGVIALQMSRNDSDMNTAMEELGIVDPEWKEALRRIVG